MISKHTIFSPDLAKYGPKGRIDSYIMHRGTYSTNLMMSTLNTKNILATKHGYLKNRRWKQNYSFIIIPNFHQGILAVKGWGLQKLWLGSKSYRGFVTLTRSGEIGFPNPTTRPAKSLAQWPYWHKSTQLLVGVQMMASSCASMQGTHHGFQGWMDGWMRFIIFLFTPSFTKRGPWQRWTLVTSADTEAFLCRQLPQKPGWRMKMCDGIHPILVTWFDPFFLHVFYRWIT